MTDVWGVFFGLGLAALATLLLIPLADAWINYGIGAGIFATVFLGIPVLGVWWMGYDITKRSLETL